MNRRVFHIAFVLVALVLATHIVTYYNEQPGYTDAYYHYNGAVRLADGLGFTEEYLWTYIGAPPRLPAPSHLYWMPGTSIVASLGMTVFGASFRSAQIGLIVCLWGASLLTYVLGYRLKQQLRHAWASGFMLLLGGFFLRVWGTTDTFAPYALFGSLALFLIGMGASATTLNRRWWLLAGVGCALAHLIRTDGLLLLIVGWSVLFLLFRVPWRLRFQWFVVFSVAYFLVMLPWFVRNLSELGTPLPSGGTQAIWYTEYDDLFNYPPDANPQTFFKDGLALFFASRWDAFNANLQNFIAVEGFIVLFPFMVGALWSRRKQPFWRGVGLFALGIHGAFTLLFPFPGVRGGLFHASAALMPFWIVLGLAGVDGTIEWIAKRRRNWRPKTAQPIFTLAVLALVLWLSLNSARGRREIARTPGIFSQYMAIIPPDARVFRNDPAEFYYYTGRGGVVLPNESPETLRTIAQIYDIDYAIFEYPNVPAPLWVDQMPDFMQPIPFDLEGIKIYAIKHD